MLYGLVRAVFCGKENAMYGNHWIDAEGLDDWDFSIEKVVGGFIWLAFSEEEPWKMLCISADKSTVFDCKNGTVSQTECEFDENERIALCSDLRDDMLTISGQYGGALPQTAPRGERIESVKRSVFEYGKDLVREEVTFIAKDGRHQVIYEGYLPYIYGFSPDGNYFIFANDGGLTVLKRK